MKKETYEFWAFRSRPIVLKGEKIIFTMDKKPVAEAVCAFVEPPGKSQCDSTGKFLNQWKVFWHPDTFKKYKDKTAAVNTPDEWKDPACADIFTFDKKPVAETVCHHIEEPGKSKCDETQKYHKHWKIFWSPKSFKKYKLPDA